ncbi:MAG: hypothetical protein JW384_02917 [Nitrosomonadaceae bacterium]|nr:hypothetical protein [Nitrosomonadaceae bacterium]
MKCELPAIFHWSNAFNFHVILILFFILLRRGGSDVIFRDLVGRL